MFHEIQLGNKKIYLVGTAHISKLSVEEVEAAIDSWQPDTVAIEICQKRFSAITNPKNFRELDLFRLLKERKAGVLLVSLVLAGFQKRMGKKMGSLPGMEMLKAVEVAETKHLKLALIDRDVNTTLRRAWRILPFLEKGKILAQLLFYSRKIEKIDDQDLSRLMKDGSINELVQGLSVEFPHLKQVLIDERDQYMAKKIQNLPGEKILAVVGAAHLAGVTQELHNPSINLENLSKVPKSYFYLLTLLIPLGLAALAFYGWHTQNLELTRDILWRWVFAHSILAALGALLAGGHLLSILAAFLVAPFTSLQPIIKAGWVAGLVEVLIRKPRTKDFEHLSEDITRVQGFYQNNITRALLVTLFATLGSALGTLISLPLLFKLW